MTRRPLPPTGDAGTDRRNRKRHLAALARSIAHYEKRLDAAMAERDAYLIESHGVKRAGGLSYDELAQNAGVSKGRVIQIVQGKSDYSKRQTEDTRKRGDRVNGHG